jgi:hypothetical protein
MIRKVLGVQDPSPSQPVTRNLLYPLSKGLTPSIQQIATSHYTVSYTNLSKLIVRDSIADVCSSAARVFGLPKSLHIPVARAIADRRGGAGVF